MLPLQNDVCSLQFSKCFYDKVVRFTADLIDNPLMLLPIETGSSPSP